MKKNKLLYGLLIVSSLGCASPQKPMDLTAESSKLNGVEKRTLTYAWKNAIENSKNNEWKDEYHNTQGEYSNGSERFVETIQELSKTFTPQEFSNLEVNCPLRFFADWVAAGFNANDAKLFCSAWMMGSVFTNIESAQSWRTAGFGASETIEYREAFGNDIPMAISIKSMGLTVNDASNALKAINNTLNTGFNPNIDPKDPAKYNYSFRPYYIYANNKESLETFLLPMFRYQNDKLALVQRIKNAEVFYNKSPSEVSVMSLDWFKCPWGNEQIVKIKDIQSKQEYWTIQGSLQ